MHTPLNRFTSLLLAGAIAGVMAFVPACSGDKAADPDPCLDCDAQAGQLRVTNRSARACELLVEATDGRVISVDFGADVSGKAISEGDRSGISLISNGAAALPEIAGIIHFDGALKLLQSTCFDEAGGALAGDSVEL
ncbi:MAG: hypothetical protein RIT81_27110 [Deltaproteobacteria bacterium]